MFDHVKLSAMITVVDSPHFFDLFSSKSDVAGTLHPRKALRGGIPKSILKRPCQFLAINAHKMAPRTTQWLQERHCGAPTKGLAWSA